MPLPGEVLSAMGCDQKWIGWIRSCITSARFAVLVNGEPTTKMFHSGRGLRQRGSYLFPFVCSGFPGA